MSDLDLIISLGKDLFRETGGEDISGSKEGPEFGQSLFEYRCRWIKENLPKYQ